MAEIQIYWISNSDSNDSVREAKTTRTFDVKITHELMRMYTLSFGVLCTDNALKYIYPASTGTSVNVICDGQGYDVKGFEATTGNENTMTVTAEHVAYRLLNYSIPANYTCVGTIYEIAADILDKAVNTGGTKASTEFSIGTTPSLGSISFSLENTQPVTAKYAIMSLQTIGAESDYDNFTINFAESIGSGHTGAFEFGVNLGKLKRTWTAENGTTYDVDIADLQCIGGGYEFDIGDTCTITDSFIGDTITNRIITYTKYPDEPNRNSITLGVFKSDVSSGTVSMQVDIDNSVQQGTEYNKVKITAAEGYTAEATIGGKAVKVIMNATDGIKITVDGTKTFGVNSAGRTYTQSVSNSDTGGYAVIGMTEISSGNDFPGIDVYGSDNTKLFSIVGVTSASSANGIYILDSGGIRRITLTDFGNVIRDANGNKILSTTQYESYLRFGDNEMGVDATGAYKNISGTKTYL